MTMVQLLAGATQTRTQQILDQVQQYYLTKEKANVESVFTVNGFSFSGQGQNAGIRICTSSHGKIVRAKKMVSVQ